MSHSNQNETSPNIRWWKTKRAKKTAFFLLIISLISFFSWFLFIFPFVSSDDARIAMTTVRVAPSGVGGRIIKVNVTEGSLVKKNDILVEIDHRVLQSQYDKAKSKADFAEKEYRRMSLLVSQKTSTLQSLDTAKSNWEIALAEFKQAEVNLENTYIRSPIDGQVIQKIAEEGNILEAGQVAIAVADIYNPWVAANIEETSVGKVKIGQSVKINVDEGGILQGHVKEIRSATASQFALIPSDNGSGNFTKVVQRIPIKVSIESSKGQLRVGESVEIKISIREKRNS